MARIYRLRFVSYIILAYALLVVSLGAFAQATGGTLNISDEGIADLSTLDPQAGGDSNSSLVTNLIFATLTRNGDNGEIVPDLASWTISADGKTYTFNLKDDAGFSDGEPVTADDVAWSLTRSISPEIKGQGGQGINNVSLIEGATDYNDGKAQTISGLKVLGPKTLEIHLTEAAAYFPALMSQASTSVIEESTTSDATELVGAGPFKLQEWKHGQSVSLAPNTYYYGGVPKLDGVVVRFYANPETAYNAYLTGDVEVMGVVHFPSARLGEAAARPDFRKSARFGVTYLVPNTNVAPFDNPKVRLAFSQAIDRQALSSLLGGTVNPSDHVLPPGMACYLADLGLPDNSPEAAQQTLAEAGYPGGQGLPPVTYTYGANSPDQDRLAAALQQMWQQTLGVRVTLNAMEMGSYFKVLDARDFQVAMIEWGADFPDPQNFLSLQLQSGGVANNSGYGNPQFDTLTHKADVTADVQQRCELYQQAETVALDEAAWFPLYNPISTVLISPRVQGLELGPLGLAATNWADVTLAK